MSTENDSDFRGSGWRLRRQAQTNLVEIRPGMCMKKQTGFRFELLKKRDVSLNMKTSTTDPEGLREERWHCIAVWL